MDLPCSQSSLRPTHVVTCFLRRIDEQPGRILLVRRSQRVGSYRGHWAGISGFVESGVTPEEQALTEIQEETGLQRYQVHILRRGHVIEHRDEVLDRHFFIHPFLCEIEDPGAIQTDWEATEMRWILPSEMRDYETVPKLQEAYDSALSGDVLA